MAAHLAAEAGLRRIKYALNEALLGILEKNFFVKLSSSPASLQSEASERILNFPVARLSREWKANQSQQESARHLFSFPSDAKAPSLRRRRRRATIEAK